MKTIKKAAALLLTLCFMAGMMVMPAGTASAAVTLPHSYELYDEYVKPFDQAYRDETAFVNNSAWSLQMREAGGSWVADSLSVALDDTEWTYLSAPAEVKDWYCPGFRYWRGTNGPTRYVGLNPIPANHSGKRYDVAYAFTAPQSGVYKVGHGNLDTIGYFDWTQNVKGSSTHDFGIRITLDGSVVWPSEDNTRAYYDSNKDLWAKFNGTEAASAFVTPEINNLKVLEGQVIRIEYARFTEAADAFGSIIMSYFGITCTEKLPDEVVIPTEKTFYDVYDYYNSLVEETDVNSPWSVQTNLMTAQNPDGLGWEKAEVLSDWDGKYRYLHSAPEWGGNWPGVKFYYDAEAKEADERYQFGYITPISFQGSNVYAWDTAYAFTAPFTGNFTLGKGNQDKVITFDDMNYFQYQNKSAGMYSGVRVTVNGKTVWPKAGALNNKDGYVLFGNSVEGVPEKIAIPTVDMFLNEYDIVRVEFKQMSNGVAEWPWDQQIMGLVGMTYDPAASSIGVTEIREFEDLGLLYDGDVVENGFPIEFGDEVYTSLATSVNDGISFRASGATAQNIKFTLNGFTVVLNGENSTITAPDASVNTINVASSDDNNYDIAAAVIPIIATGAITGTAFELTVNGVSYTYTYQGMIPSAFSASKRAVTISSTSEDESYLFNISAAGGAAGIKLASYSGFTVVDNVLYVDTVTDAEAVKAKIENAGRFSFDSAVKTGSALTRNGSNIVYSLAVKGDATGDGVNDVRDLIRIKRAAAGKATLSAAQDIASKFGVKDKGDAAVLADNVKYILSK